MAETLTALPTTAAVAKVVVATAADPVAVAATEATEAAAIVFVKEGSVIVKGTA